MSCFMYRFQIADRIMWCCGCVGQQLIYDIDSRKLTATDRNELNFKLQIEKKKN